MKLSISRPGNHGADAEMLFLFANVPEPEVAPDAQGVRYFGPGVYHENIDAHDGDRIYIAGGVVILGRSMFWGTHGVRISGRGTVVYDGPQILRMTKVGSINRAGTSLGWTMRAMWRSMALRASCGAARG